VPEEYGVEPTAMAQLRPGNYDVHARIDDMNVNGIAASLNFGSCMVMDGRVALHAQDKDLSLVHLKAWNDWHLHEWCNAYPGRFIPCGILPVWSMDETVAEIKRLANNGFGTVTINDNPTVLGLPAIHDPYWEPFFKAIVDHDMAICLHIGAGNPAPMPSQVTPVEAYITTMAIAIAVSAADWLNLSALERYPNMKIALSEGGIGWIPYFWNAPISCMRSRHDPAVVRRWCPDPAARRSAASDHHGRHDPHAGPDGHEGRQGSLSTLEPFVKLKLTDLRKSLPPGTPTVTQAQREEIVRVRRLELQQRPLW
jgi:hypothetical protein